MKRCIVMIGMPACGKSTAGVVLAKITGRRFIDTDLLIQEQEGMLLQEIIDNKGSEYFKKAEEGVLRALEAENAVISTGGSAVYYPPAMEHLRCLGPTVYLKLSAESIRRRLKNIRTRGIAMAPAQTIEELYRSRAPLYERYADITIPAEGLNVEQTVERILAELRRQGEFRQTKR